MIKNLLVIFAMVCGSVAMAQEKNYFFVNAKLGVASPMGVYASESYAKDGLNANAELAYLFAGKKMSFGPMLAFGYFDNGLDKEKALAEDDLWIYSKTGYSHALIGVGYIYNYNFTKRFAATTHMTFGVLNSTRPEMLVSVNDVSVVFPEMTANAFTVKPGLGVRFFPGERLVLSADVEFIVADQGYIGNYTEKVAVFNLNLGIGVRF